MELTISVVLDTAGAAIAGAFIAGLVELAKPMLLPASWHTGRAPMLIAASIAALMVGVAVWDAVALGELAGTPGDIGFTGVLAWFNVTTAAIGSHAVVKKTGEVLSRPAG